MTTKLSLLGLVFLILMMALGLSSLAASAPQQSRPANLFSIDQVAAMIRQGEISAIFVNGEHLTIIRQNNLQAVARKESGSSVVDTLRTLGVTPVQLAQVKITILPPSFWETYGPLLLRLLPTLLIGGIVLLLYGRSWSIDDEALRFGKSAVQPFSGTRALVRFHHVAGNDEAKQALQEVVEFLREPLKFAVLGARIPRGVLLAGPPGTGKTLMAKAVAGEAGVPFFCVSGSEFVEMYVGVGASRVRDLFRQARRSSPCIVFIDEIDAVGRHRALNESGGSGEREQTLNQILVEMDGFGPQTKVIVIAATNRVDILDPALLRPGRFDRRVVMDAPDIKGRRAILNVHAHGKPLAADVDLEVVAKQTPGFVGADLENLLNEAAILAARRGRTAIGMAELQEAVERVLAGPERRSRLLRPREKEVLAYHEAGHAVLMYLLPHHDPVHKVTIVSRGQANGYSMSLPEEETRLLGRDQLRDQLAALLGGRVAEAMRFGDVTTGASNDLERVANLARVMVTQWGMNDGLGPIEYGERPDDSLDGDGGERCNYSQRVAEEIDEAVRLLVYEAYERAQQLLAIHWDALERVAQRLLAVETLYADDVHTLMMEIDQREFTDSRSKRCSIVAADRSY